jgi:hypothetical protein
MEKPFAITLDVGTSLANKTGSWRTARPVYLDRLPPCNNQCPAGENIQSWLNLAEAPDHGGEPVPGDHGPGLLSHLRRRLQSRQSGPAGGHQFG